MDSASFSINDIADLNWVNAFPNPSTGKTTINADMDPFTEWKAEAISLNGTKIELDLNFNQLNATKLQSGNYLIRIYNSSGEHFLRIIILD